jgi:hypothetical protein
MDHQTGRLVDDGEVLVLVCQDERNRAGLDDSGRLVVRELNQHSLAPREQS